MQIHHVNFSLPLEGESDKIKFVRKWGTLYTKSQFWNNVTLMNAVVQNDLMNINTRWHNPNYSH